MTGAWARALLDMLGGGGVAAPGEGVVVTDLRVAPSLVTALVDGRPVTLSAHPIAAGVWAAIAAQVTPGRQSEELARLLEHTWEEPLVPADVVRVGEPADVAAVVRALVLEVEQDPSTLLRWRGFDAGPRPVGDDEPWRGGDLPPLPAPARRPPESVPKRFGASGIVLPDGDLVEVLVHAYRAFGVG